MGSRRSCIDPSRPAPDHAVPGGGGGILVRVVLAEVPAPALLALDGRLGDGLADGQQRVQVQRRRPAGVVLPVAGHAHLLGPLLQQLHPLQRLPHLLLSPDDADQLSCIMSCSSYWIWNGPLASTGLSNGASAQLDSGLDLLAVQRRLPPARLLGVFGGVFPGALAEHDQVGQRVAAQPVGAVDARWRTPRRRTAPAPWTSGVSASTRTPPIT